MKTLAVLGLLNLTGLGAGVFAAASEPSGWGDVLRIYGIAAPPILGLATAVVVMWKVIQRMTTKMLEREGELVRAIDMLGETVTLFRQMMTDRRGGG